MAQPLDINIAPLSGISFPKDIGNIGYYMSFTFSEYHRDSILAGANIFMSGGQTINLPMPDTINDHPSVVWDQQSLTELAGKAAGSFVPSELSTITQAAGTVADLATTVYGWQQGVKLRSEEHTSELQSH